MPEKASPQLEDGYTRIADELMEALAKCGAPAAVHRVVWAVARETYGYGKKARKVKRARLAEVMGVKERRARQMIEQAKALDMVTVNGWEIAIQKDHSRWPKPAEAPAGFGNRQSTAAALAETGTGTLPLLNRQQPLPGKPAAAPAAQRHRQKDSTSTSTPSTTNDAVGTNGDDQQPGPANSPRAQLVQDLWEAFGFKGSPPSSKPAAFSGAMRLLDGKVAVGKELLTHINTTEPQPEDGDSEAGFFVAYLKEHLAAPEGVGWRRKPNSQQRPVKSTDQVPEHMKHF